MVWCTTRRYESFVIINNKLYVITNPREKYTALHRLHTESGTLRRGPEDRHKICVGCSSQTLHSHWNDEQHRCSLVRWGWLSPWALNKLKRVDFFFVFHGLLDRAVFPGYQLGQLFINRWLKIPWAVLCCVLTQHPGRARGTSCTRESQE